MIVSAGSIGITPSMLYESSGHVLAPPNRSSSGHRRLRYKWLEERRYLRAADRHGCNNRVQSARGRWNPDIGVGVAPARTHHTTTRASGCLRWGDRPRAGGLSRILRPCRPPSTPPAARPSALVPGREDNARTSVKHRQEEGRPTHSTDAPKQPRLRERTGAGSSEEWIEVYRHVGGA